MMDAGWLGFGRAASWIGAGLGATALVRGAVRRGRAIDLTGRTVLVTGGTRGLGLSIAEEAGAQGANVAICGRDLTAVASAAETLRRKGYSVLARACDLSDRQAAEAFVDEVARTFGRIDVVVNNAGSILVGPLESVTVEKMEQAMASNLWSAVHVTLRALPHLRARGGEGRLVNITSIGGLAGVPHLLPYDTSKFALMGFSEALRAELDGRADRPKVVTVIPGLMRTGSFYNAEFDGKPSDEFAWFSVSSSMPLISIDARVAARRIVRATRDGRAFLRIGFSGHALDLLHRASPRLSVWLMGMASRLLPEGPGASSDPMSRGRHVQSDLPGSFMLRLGDAAALEHNEAPPSVVVHA